MIRSALLLALAFSLPASAHAEEKILFDFKKDGDTSGWMIEDDGVMGGLSKGRFQLNNEGHATFSGNVSLENNGGFSSVQWNFDPIDVSPYSPSSCASAATANATSSSPRPLPATATITKPNSRPEPIGKP
jgi:hypothetical protein